MQILRPGSSLGQIRKRTIVANTTATPRVLLDVPSIAMMACLLGSLNGIFRKNSGAANKQAKGAQFQIHLTARSSTRAGRKRGLVPRRSGAARGSSGAVSSRPSVGSTCRQQAAHGQPNIHAQGSNLQSVTNGKPKKMTPWDGAAAAKVREEEEKAGRKT